MFLDLALGPLTEPHWDSEAEHAQYRRRRGFSNRHGLRSGDRVCLHYGNTPEFFVDLMAIWSLGGCAIPIDARQWDTVAKLLAFVERHTKRP